MIFIFGSQNLLSYRKSQYMFLIDRIIPIYFFISLAIGFFLTYIFTPAPKVIFKFPTPDTVDDLTYKDQSNNCFKLKADEITCPANKDLIYSIPPQHNIIETN